MTSEDETYIHLDECIRSLNEAWYVAQEVRRTAQKSAITAAAYRYALVAYARPYTDSDGIHRNRKNRNAYKRKTPEGLATEEIALHNEILRFRNKILAHSDLTVKDARLYVGPYGSKSTAVIGSNIQPSLPDVSAVISLIEYSLDVLYEERTQ